MIFLGVTGVVLFAAFMSIHAFSVRLNAVLAPSDVDTILSDSNMSALVLIKAFQMAAYGIVHFPMGVHIMDMQILAPYSDISYLRDFMFDANSKDGASVLFKGICEYGYLFIAFVLLSLWFFLARFIRLKELTLSRVLELAFCFALFSSFVRGGSYFHGVVPLALSLSILGIGQSRSVLGTGPIKRTPLPVVLSSYSLLKDTGSIAGSQSVGPQRIATWPGLSDDRRD